MNRHVRWLNAIWRFIPVIKMRLRWNVFWEKPVLGWIITRQLLHRWNVIKVRCRVRSVKRCMSWVWVIIIPVFIQRRLPHWVKRLRWMMLCLRMHICTWAWLIWIWRNAIRQEWLLSRRLHQDLTRWWKSRLFIIMLCVYMRLLILLLLNL